MNLDERAINVFTDGSCLPSPRRGGTGICFVTVNEAGHEELTDVQPQGFSGATNQQMELMAPIQALQELTGRVPLFDLDQYSKVVIHTDSQYVANNVDRAKFVWSKSRWFGIDGAPILNADLWKNLVKEIKGCALRVDFKWIKGHSAKHPHNKRADKLAKGSAKGALQEAWRPVRVRRRQTDEQTVLGSVVPEGQRVTVRIVVDQYLPVQRMYHYKLEVVSPDSPYIGKVDDFTSHLMISAGHTYEVRLNDEPKNPRIVEVFGEINAEGG